MFGVGPTELLLVFLIVLVLFGAKKIPEIAQGLGKGISEFKKATRNTPEITLPRPPVHLSGGDETSGDESRNEHLM